MNFMAFNMDGCKRSCRAEILACSTSDASFFINGRDPERILLIRIALYHSYRSGRAVAGAVSAAHIVFIDNACIEVHDGMSYLDR